MNYYLLVLENQNDLEGMPLNLVPNTLHYITQSLSWQLQGGFPKTRYVKTERIDAELFRCIDTGKEYKSHAGAYTDAAYKQFVDNWRSK